MCEHHVSAITAQQYVFSSDWFSCTWDLSLWLIHSLNCMHILSLSILVHFYSDKLLPHRSTLSWHCTVAWKVIGGAVGVGGEGTAAGGNVEPIFIVKQLHSTAVVQQRMDDSCSSVNTFWQQQPSHTHKLKTSGSVKGRKIWQEIYLI